jgi:hypothetical protein
MISAEQLVGVKLVDFVAGVLSEHECVDVVSTRIAGRTYVSVKDLGVSLVSFDGESVKTVQIHCEGDGYQASALMLPGGISMSDGRDVSTSKLGSPDQSGGGGLNPLTGGVLNAWDVFFIAGYRCHLEYAPDERSIVLVSISARPV